VETGRVEAPTRVVAEFARSEPDRKAAALLYGLTMVITAILFFARWIYGSRRALRPDADPRFVSGITRSYLPGVPLYATATLLAYASPTASLIMFGSLAVSYALSSSFFAPRTASSGDPPS
jgi:hypothetical protein